MAIMLGIIMTCAYLNVISGGILRFKTYLLCIWSEKWVCFYGLRYTVCAGDGGMGLWTVCAGCMIVVCGWVMWAKLQVDYS